MQEILTKALNEEENKMATSWGWAYLQRMHLWHYKVGLKTQLQPIADHGTQEPMALVAKLMIDWPVSLVIAFRGQKPAKRAPGSPLAKQISG